MTISTPTQIDSNDTIIYPGSGVATSADVPAGAAIFLWIIDESSSSGVTNIESITDSAGNIYTIKPAQSSAVAIANWLSVIAYCLDCKELPEGSSFSATAVSDSDNILKILSAAYVTGVNGGVDADVSSGNSDGTSTGFSLSTETLENSNEILLGMFASVINGGSGVTDSMTNINSTGYGIADYQIVSDDSSFTWTVSYPEGDYSALLLSFQATETGGGATPQWRSMMGVGN